MISKDSRLFTLGLKLLQGITVSNIAEQRSRYHIGHCQLDRRRRSNLCHITGTTLRPHSFYSVDFMQSMKKNKKIKTVLFFSIALQLKQFT